MVEIGYLKEKVDLMICFFVSLANYQTTILSFPTKVYLFQLVKTRCDTEDRLFLSLNGLSKKVVFNQRCFGVQSNNTNDQPQLDRRITLAIHKRPYHELEYCPY